jgi:hypothetical protein
MAKFPEQHYDASDILQTSRDDRTHPINKGVDPGLAERSDFNAKGVEVPARATRERVNPSTANSQRRTPLIDVTPITSGSGNSHIAEPPPSRL